MLATNEIKSRPMRVLVVDDEKLARKRIVDLIKKREGVKVVGEYGNGNDAIEALNQTNADLLFLDIQMQDMDGFDVLAQVDSEILPKVIFVTAYDQYALKAFEFHAIDYLLKPFDDERFDEMLEHARKEISKEEVPNLVGELSTILSTMDKIKLSELKESTSQEKAESYPKRLVIKSTGRVEFVNVSDVSWIGAEGSYVKLHTDSKSHLMRGSMKKLEQKLNPDDFLRIHRSTIINIHMIKELKPHFHGEYVVILKTGARLKLSRNYRDSAERILGGEF